MNFSVLNLKTERQWRASTGLDKDRFYKLFFHFERAYFEVHGAPLKERLVSRPRPYCIQDEEDLLFFTLFSLKSGLTYDVLGVVCGMDGSNAKRNQKTGLAILNRVLDSLGHAPRRNFLNIEDFEQYFSNEETLIIDATEQRIQRPSDQERQKEYYSGKKKRIP